MEKLLNRGGSGFVSQCFSISVQEEATVQQPELQGVLATHKRVFQEPKGLPPPRNIDHTISLTVGSDPANIDLIGILSSRRVK